MHKRASLITLAAAVAAMFAVTATTRAQQIYLQTFNTDDSANWVQYFSYTAGTAFNSVSNSLVDYNFDYVTKAGIPLAPHSVLFGSDTVHHALKISAVYTNANSGSTVSLKPGAAVAGMSVCPTNFSITANFVMHADMWMNIDCTAYAATNTDFTSSAASFATTAHNSTASTVFYGCGYGTAGTQATTPGQTDAIWVGALTDNGTTAQLRMYGPSIQASYQDFSYQTSGTLTPAFPGDPLVYNVGNSVNGLGTRNLLSTTANPPYTANQLSTNLATGVAWRNIFPPSPVPQAQQALFPQQVNNYSIPGFFAFKWHDVSVEKVGNVIIYKVDGNIIATANYSSAGTPPGNFLTFVASRTGSTAASPVSGVGYTNLNFALFANIVVSNFNNVINVTAPTPTTSEATPSSPGVFNISRSSAGVPLTVNYTLTGSATNGAQYQLLATNVTFLSTATDTNITVTPIDDGIANPTTTVVLTLQPGTGYQGAGSAVVDILDADTPTIDLSGTSQAYGRYTNTLGQGNNDFLSYTLTRRGNLTPGSDLNVNLSFSGNAVSGTDFLPPASVTVPNGAQTATLIIPPLDNTTVTSNRTFTINIAGGTGYAIGTGSATGTVVTAHYPAAPVLLSDDLTDPNDVTNWNVVYGCGDPLNDSLDFQANFGFTLAGAPVLAIPPPPNGNANALHLTCNKDINPGSPGAINCYYTNLFLSGNYAVRFNMNLIEGETKANSTEGAVFGINHTGSLSNWWYGGGFITNQTWSSDGIWYYVATQPGVSVTSGDYAEYTGAGGTNGNLGWSRIRTNSQSAFSTAFKINPGPFTTLDVNFAQTAGTPANGSPANGWDDSTWADVEIKQVGGIVTMSINHTTIFTYTNTTVWQGGYLMLGYADPFGATVGNQEAGVYYANLQVVQLPASPPPLITINSIALSGGNVVITFTTSSVTDTISSFTLTSSGTVNGTYNGVSPAATITSLGSQQFQASTPYTGGQVFYKIFHP